MILIPFEPNAGPTGGDGFAAPPLICNLISPATSLAIFYQFIKNTITKKMRVTSTLFFFHLHKVQFERSSSTEDFDHYLKFLLFIINFFNDTTESAKWSVSYFNSLANSKRNNHFLFRIL